MIRPWLSAFFAGAVATWTVGAAAQVTADTARYLITLKAEQDSAAVMQDLAPVVDRAATYSAKVVLVETSKVSELHELVGRNGRIEFIEPLARPVLPPMDPPKSRPYARNSLLTHNVLMLAAKYGLTGKGVTVGVWDGGPVLANHVEFDDRVEMRVKGDPDNHATHVAGTVAAVGRDKEAAGMAPGAHIVSFSMYDDLPSIAAALATANAPQITNHSYVYPRGWSYDEGSGYWCWWGDPRVNDREDHMFGKYNTSSRAIDDLAAQFPTTTMFVAAGNSRGDINNPTKSPYWRDTYCMPYALGNKVTSKTPLPALNDRKKGYDTLEGYGVAKNVVVVGAITDAPEGATVVQPDLVQVTHFSNWGPTDDGRIKPDIVANGSQVFSPAVQPLGNGKYKLNAYAFKDGTSQATPAAAGIGALLVELSRNKHGSALQSDEMKAVLIHTAISPHEGPSYQIGWGAIDAEAAGALVAGDKGKIVSAVLPQGGQPYNLKAQVAPAQGQPRVSLVWIDPPAAINASGVDDTTKALTFDLDLLVIDPRGRKFHPWSLDPNNPSLAATRSGPNRRDNVERVDVPEAASGGDWTIDVRGPNSAANRRFVLAITGFDLK